MLYIIYPILYTLHIILLSVSKICATLCHSTSCSISGSSVLHYLLELLKLLSSWWCYLIMSSSHLPILYLFAFSFCPWGSPGKNPAMSCHSLIQWTFLRTLHYDLSILDGPAWLGSKLLWAMQVPLPWQGCDPWRGSIMFSSVQFSPSVMSDSLWPHESQHARPPCPSSTPGVHSNSCPLSRWCHPAISPSVVPFSSCP